LKFGDSIGDEGIKGVNKIILSNLPKLEVFLANHCKLKKIKINDCHEINDFRVGNNSLEDLGFLESLSASKLRILSLHSNELVNKNLSVFNGFTELRQLFLDNADGKKRNTFCGSLDDLKSLANLECLNISHTHIEINDG